MEIILLERIQKLGQMGDIVRVKDGYARNHLLPSGKALRANDANKARFESERTQLEARNLELRKEAEGIGEKLAGQSFVAIRQAGQTGQLYGSVTPRDLAEIMTEGGFSIARSQIVLARPIKEIGLHPITVSLHPEVDVEISVNVARSEDEAERQARGEDLSVETLDDDEILDEADGDENADGSDDTESLEEIDSADDGEDKSDTEL